MVPATRPKVLPTQDVGSFYPGQIDDDAGLYYAGCTRRYSSSSNYNTTEAKRS